MSWPHIQQGRLRRRPLRRSASRRSAYCLLSRPLTGICHRLLRARVCARTISHMRANGVNGQAHFDGQALTITRSSVLGMMTQGRNEKVIPLSAIGAVQFRPPTLTANGVWSVSVVGEVQSSKNARGMRAVSKVARDDENSIIVRHGQGAAFKALGEAINAARVAPAPVVAPAPTPAPCLAPAVPSGGVGVGEVVAQLRGLGAMHWKGRLSDEDFIASVHELLPRL